MSDKPKNILLTKISSKSVFGFETPKQGLMAGHRLNNRKGNNKKLRTWLGRRGPLGKTSTMSMLRMVAILFGVFFLSSTLRKTRYTLVAACNNREDTLLHVIDSWFGVKEVDEIILLDWASSSPIKDLLVEHNKTDSRLKIFRVETNSPFVLTWAYNIAIDLSNGKYVLKVDCDTQVKGSILRDNPLGKKTFYSGDWTQAHNDEEKHLNGIFLISRRDFLNVGGYDERIQGYGWDDSDLYGRLKTSGMTQQALPLKLIRHYHHDEAARHLNFLGQQNETYFETQLNRELSDRLPIWKPGSSRIEYRIQNGTIVSILKSVRSQREMLSLDDDKPLQNAAYATLIQYYKEYGTWAEMPLQYKINLANFFERAKAQHGKSITVHAMHGLSNRLRAIASAIALASKDNRYLRIIWEKNIHVYAELHELLTISMGPRSFEVWSEYNSMEQSEDVFAVYDYMQPEQKYKSVSLDNAHIYFRSAYTMVSDIVSEQDTNDYLHLIRPSAAVQLLVDSLNIGSNILIGVHIRCIMPREETRGITSDEYSEEGWKDIIKYRKLTKQAIPLFKMLAVEYKHKTNGSIFLSYDDSAALQHFSDIVDVIYLQRECNDRSLKCLEYAVADLFLLGKSKYILGSYWSSYTEVAGRLAGIEVIYPYNYHTMLLE